MSYTPQELLELYHVARQIIWRYNLDSMEVQALTQAMRSVERAGRDLVYGNNTLKELWQKNRADDLLMELDRLMVGLRDVVYNDISNMAGFAGSESAAWHYNTMSFEGKIPGIDNIRITPEQFKQFFQETPLNGHTLLQWVKRSFSHNIVDGMRADINAGVLLGEGYPKLVDRIMLHLEDITRKDAITIARSYVQSANVAASEAVMMANEDVLRGWKWSAVLEPSNFETGRGTCTECAILDGNEYGFGEVSPEMPLHLNCLAAETPVFVPDKIAAFVATYEGVVFDLVLSNGARFTVTPKHMFLARQGFATTESLRKGDQIFYNPVVDGVIFGYPDNYRDNSSIANVIESFSKQSGMVSMSVPTSSEYLHGDGEFIKGNIEVVTFESLLMGDLEAFSSEFFDQLNFSLANIDGVNLESLGRFLSPLFWLRLASDSFVGGLSVSDVFSQASLRHHKPISNGIVPSLNTILGQYSRYDISGNLELVGNSILGYPGSIKANDLYGGELVSKTIRKLGLNVQDWEFSLFNDIQDGVITNTELFSNFSSVYSRDILFADVVSIKSRKFTGHVYDLQSLTGMYHVFGALSSNCRCVKVPITKTYRELGLDIDEVEEVARPWTEREDLPIGEGGRNIEDYGKHKGNYDSWFESRGEKFQRNVLGPRRYELWEKGKVDFKDFVNPKTGKLIPLKELRRAD